MRRKDIINYIVEEMNEKAQRKNKPAFTYRDIDNMLVALKKCLMECVFRGEDFVLGNLFKVETWIAPIKNKRDPRTNVLSTRTERIKSKFLWCYSIDQDIRYTEVNDELKKLFEESKNKNSEELEENLNKERFAK